jgi:hypothetical protein
MTLDDEQVQYGFYYHFADRQRKPWVTEVSQYAGGKELTINCTQLDDGLYKSPKEKKRVLNEWCEFLIDNPNTFTELTFGTRMPQELFEAICHQQNLERLEIKWGAYKDVSAIESLQELKLLEIGPGAAVESIAPVSKLPNLIGLYVENFQKINDYSQLEALRKLESLTICGNGMGPQYIRLDSLEFLRQMTQLRHLRLTSIRLASKDYSPILSLKRLEHLTLGVHRDFKNVLDDLRRLPKLKWGLIKERPDLYE